MGGGLSGRFGRFLVTAVPYAWLIVFFVIPFLIVFKISFSSSVIAQPPYVPIFDVLADGVTGTWAKAQEFTLKNYARLISNDLYAVAYLQSLRIAAISTVITLLIGYPIAYAMARAPEGTRPILLMLIILPFWTSFLIRVYAWIGIIKNEGFLNMALMGLGLIDQPLVILNTNTAVYIGIVYSYLPFMILPLYASLEKIDGTLLEAASDLGCPPARAFWQITWPLSRPGVVAGCLLVFIPAVGEFVIPDLLGGSETLMIGKTMWNEFFEARDWPAAAAVATVLLLVLVVPIVLFQRAEAKRELAG